MPELKPPLRLPLMPVGERIRHVHWRYAHYVADLPDTLRSQRVVSCISDPHVESQQFKSPATSKNGELAFRNCIREDSFMVQGRGHQYAVNDLEHPVRSIDVAPLYARRS